MSGRKKITVALLGVVAAVGVLIGALYLSIVSGGSVARGREPPAVEVAVAQWLLHRSVPPELKTLKNPLSTAADSADVSAGRETLPAEVRDLSRQRWERQDRHRCRAVSAST